MGLARVAPVLHEERQLVHNSRSFEKFRIIRILDAYAPPLGPAAPRSGILSPRSSGNGHRDP
jgi:hypothetical protein